ncbi:TPA_asm: helix-turn-helix domain-containing protein [Listeria monocytogenes]|uniref:helix-turn-helix domain-containing protein n=1 Tax=Listeria monocytogenes TaxID=1639 RepID=UPI000BE0CD8B|nr:helix-turn-helix transcriptional regulator [Listeria monocytogenes]EAE4828451.1 XRE family transcriptional regulator [Listeria monocytogenes]EHP7829754.1 helix-turn-helix transcriptional regulator [Listeria monocytogenes]MCP7950628.1 helix-turn-helix transcriptional regulator [Listeria monocytogenes]MCP7985431.1 helix-turn-helix transcriptional regulator [Listeria monocytogenes]MCP7990197.1 helix-turn-helix transcriptional regulator [Listeria monocytogenes]
MTLLDRIKELCKKHSISVKMLEENLNFPSNTIYQWKKRTPGIDKLQKVADYFDVSLDYLLGRTSVVSIPKENSVLDTIAAHIDPGASTKELEEIIAYIEEKQKEQLNKKTINLVDIAAKKDKEIANFVKENPDFRYEVEGPVIDEEEAIHSVKTFINIYKQNKL